MAAWCENPAFSSGWEEKLVAVLDGISLEGA